MGKQISVREYAKRRGVSHVAVLKAIKLGRITRTPSGKIDPDKSDAAWESNTSPDMRSKRLASGSQSQETYSKARAIKEQFAAGLMKLEFEERSGKLVDRQTIVDQYSQLVIAARTRFLEIPSKLAPQVAVADDPVVCQALIDQAISEALEELGNYGSNTEKSTTAAA